MKKNIATILLLSLTLSACGSDSDSNDNNNDTDTDEVCTVDCDTDTTDTDTTDTDSDNDTETDSDNDTDTDSDNDTDTDSDNDTDTDSDNDTDTDSDNDTDTDTDTDTTDTVTDDFESYTAGELISDVSDWQTANIKDNSDGLGTTTAEVSSSKANGGSNSLYLEDAYDGSKPSAYWELDSGNEVSNGSISIDVYTPSTNDSVTYINVGTGKNNADRYFEVRLNGDDFEYENANGDVDLAENGFAQDVWHTVQIAWTSEGMVTVSLDGESYAAVDQSTLGLTGTTPTQVTLYTGTNDSIINTAYFDNLNVTIGEPEPITYSGVPYDYEQYQDALDNANLQQTDLSDCTDDDINASCSKSDVVSAGGYADYDSEYFYIDETTGWLTFEMEGDSNRTELRFTENFLSNLEDTSYTMSAELLPISPEESVASSTDGEEITLLQVHNKGENAETDETVLSHPLLRITWDGEEQTDAATDESYTNAYWAVIKTTAYECKTSDEDYAGDDLCASSDNYTRYYLGDFDADTPTKFEVQVYNSQLIIDVDNVNKVTFDISYWSELYSYFKAGVYNQFESGNSVVQFKTITYSEKVVSDSSLLVNDLDTSLPPSSNFDLTTWNLSVPIDSGDEESYAKATTVTVEDLNDGYELTDYFWTNTSDGGMVFKDYIDGARTSENTTYTRTELREMLRGEDTSISTQGVNGNNWVFSSVPADQQAVAGGVDGNMKATLAVNHVTTTGYSSYIGRVIIGQIHAASDEPIRLYYRLLNGHSKGSVYFAHEPSNGNDEQWYEMIGSRSSSADEPEDGIELGEKFSYEIDVSGNTMTVTLTREDGTTLQEIVDMSDSGYSDGYYDKDGDGVDETEDYMYFKAGVYNQNKLVDEDEDGVDDNGAEADDYVQATFYYLSTSHD